MKKIKFNNRIMLSCLLFPVILASPANIQKSTSLISPNKNYISLFDGKSLAGWHTNEQKISHGTGGHWQVENGILTGEQDPPGSGNGGILMTDKEYGDFELTVQLHPDWGVDSGIFLRTNDKGECFQVYVDYHDNGFIGSISTERAGKPRMINRPFYIDGITDDNDKLIGFDTQSDKRGAVSWGEDYLAKFCAPKQWKKAWEIGKWNTLKIRCVGKYPTITTWINGTKIAEFDSETSKNPQNNKEELFDAFGREGHIALQVHGGKGWPEGAKCRWKNIQIKEL